VSQDEFCIKAITDIQKFQYMAIFTAAHGPNWLQTCSAAIIITSLTSHQNPVSGGSATPKKLGTMFSTLPCSATQKRAYHSMYKR
jgi:hypothetical protein